VFVTGYATGTDFETDYVTMAYDAASGSPLWQRRYDGPVHREDDAHVIAVSPNGSTVFVSGDSDGPTAFDMATVAYDAATGSPIWLARETGVPDSATVPAGMTVSPDGSKVFITATSGATFVGEDFITVAYDAASGSRIWFERYDGPPGDSDAATDLAVSPDGSKVFVTGSSYGVHRSDFATLAYDAATGEGLWIARYNDPANGYDDPFSMAVSPDGFRVFVAGKVSRDKSSFVMATVAYDAESGSIVWARRYHDFAHISNNAYSVSAAPDGSNVYVSGYTYLLDGRIRHTSPSLTILRRARSPG